MTAPKPQPATVLLPEPPDGTKVCAVMVDGDTPIIWRDDVKGHADWPHHPADQGCWYFWGKGWPRAWSTIAPYVVEMHLLTPYEVTQ